jgi:hypothetical protein
MGQSSALAVALSQKAEGVMSTPMDRAALHLRALLGA